NCSRMRCCLFCLQTEGLSLALLDAMGAGVCVLASDIPENCELVEGAGFTFRRGDVADLERLIRLLLADSHVREEAARSAQERIRQHVATDRSADRASVLESCRLAER